MVSNKDYIPRRFLLEREKDYSGVSGTGVVAFGLQFRDGKCIMRWNGDIAQVSIWDDISEIEAIHGHGGSTQVHFIDC